MGICPHCGEMIDSVIASVISVENDYGPTLGTAFSCPNIDCGKILSISEFDQNANPARTDAPGLSDED